MEASEAYAKYSELGIFGSNEDTEHFPLSAMLEVEITDEKTTTVRGSSLLADQARATITVDVEVAGGGPQSSRCPVVSIKGKEAATVAAATAQSYSAYVVKLFDNFD